MAGYPADKDNLSEIRPIPIRHFDPTIKKSIWTYKFSTERRAQDCGDENGSDHNPGFRHAYALLQGLNKKNKKNAQKMAKKLKKNGN